MREESARAKREEELGREGENHYAARRGRSFGAIFSLFCVENEGSNERERVRWSGKLATRRRHALLPLTDEDDFHTYLHVVQIEAIHRLRAMGQV